MKPTAVKRCIIEIKGHEDIRASLCTLTTVTDTGAKLLDPGILTSRLRSMMVSFILKGYDQCGFFFFFFNSTCAAKEKVEVYLLEKTARFPGRRT